MHLAIQPDEEITAESEGVEIRRANDHLMIGFKAATENPIITLEFPEDMKYIADPAIAGGVKLKSTVVPDQFEYERVYFPPGHMRVRWWPKNS